MATTHSSAVTGPSSARVASPESKERINECTGCDRLGGPVKQAGERWTGSRAAVAANAPRRP